MHTGLACFLLANAVEAMLPDPVATDNQNTLTHAGAFDMERCSCAAEHLAAVTKRFQDPESMKVSTPTTAFALLQGAHLTHVTSSTLCCKRYNDRLVLR